jgi:hypothetical protein
MGALITPTAPRYGPRELLERQTAALAREVSQCGEVNIFLLDVPWLPIDDLARKMAAAARFERVTTGAAESLRQDLAQVVCSGYSKAANARGGDRGRSCINAARAATQIPHLYLCNLPAHQHSAVLLYPCSTFEVGAATLPLMLSDPTISREDAAFVRTLCDVAACSTEAQINAARSIWVYVRLTEGAEAELHRQTGHAAELVEVYAQYKRSLDSALMSTKLCDFARTHHFFVVNVADIRLDRDEVAMDVVRLVCRRVLDLNKMGVWGRKDQAASICSQQYLEGCTAFSTITTCVNSSDAKRDGAA